MSKPTPTIDKAVLAQLQSLSSLQLKCLLVRLLARLDRQLSQQLSEIINNPQFSALESSWRNLQSLLALNVNSNKVKVKLLDFDWTCLSKDLNQSPSLQRSLIYAKTAQDELNTLGGEPFGILLVDHYLNIDPQSWAIFDELYTTELLGSLGEMLLAPVIMAIKDDFFGSSKADWLADIDRIERIIEGPDFVGWRALRQKSLARYLGLVMPSIQLREAYREQNFGFMFNQSDSNGLWGNGAYGFVITAIREFDRIGWFGFMKSRWQGKYQGALLNLPVKMQWYDRTTQAINHLIQPQPRVRLFADIAQFYADRGFIPLSRNPLSERYFYVDNRSVWHVENPQEHVVGLIQTTLLSCRIGHYLKAKMRELIGNANSVNECQQQLQSWIEQYCSLVVSADEAILAKYPLRTAKITVSESAFIPGRYITELTLQPQYQFDGFNSEVMLSTRDGAVDANQAVTA